MSASAATLGDKQHLSMALEAAIGSIAPSWPLDRMIAVNPYWERRAQSFREVGEKLGSLAGSSLTMPLEYYRKLWEKGAIKEIHLEKACREKASSLSVFELINMLDAQFGSLTPAPLLCDTLDAHRDLCHEPAWCDTITHQVAQFCAAYFDQAQADWRPQQDEGLYTSWRNALTKDHSVAWLMKAGHIPAKAKSLAQEPLPQIQQALTQLAMEEAYWPEYLQAVLLRVSGWASWCAYLRWQARLSEQDDDTLVDLLAIRLSWELLLDNGERHQGSMWNRWQADWRKHFQPADTKQSEALFLWQRAHEITYQDELFSQLSQTGHANPATSAETAPEVQAVFCIDVRSEVFRRHLEAQSPAIQTLGFAGFFGLPISYTPIGTHASRPQLPGLLAPALDIGETTGNTEIDSQAVSARQRALKQEAKWKPFKTLPASAFMLVETLGLAYAAKLVQRTFVKQVAFSNSDSLGLKPVHRQHLRPSLKSTLKDKPGELADIARQVLQGMGLGEQLAPLVLLIGHGSQNLNNPQRAGLDCGACCGQTGEVNSRALADLLNDATVRDMLDQQGIAIPASTQFVAGLHNTTTDEVQLFDTDLLPSTHENALATLREQLACAGLAARRERAPLLGLAHLVDKPDKLLKAVKQRANDWAQTRPEWGLANNAAFIVAPRWRSQKANLAGRSFLHDYDYRKDDDGSLLELIMTAPMVVTHWINMQYHASTVDPLRYGSGNKTLHNVVGGRLGVFEGNGGDLRIGLAKQSVHDGQDWRHDPLRLTVVIDAPREAIEKVIHEHEVVQQLFDNEWVYLARFDDVGIESYQNGVWQPWTAHGYEA